jgi:hypothetical protein
MHDQHAPGSSIAAVTSPASSDLQRFVRGTLGCKCPDDVFQSVAIDYHEDHTRLVIGNRLLIYVTQVETEPLPGKAVSRLVERGLADRNSQRLNRLRLVIAHTQPPLDHADAKAAFNEVVGDDDRAYLHFIATEQLPAELRRDVTSPAPATILPKWLQGDPIAEHLRSLGRPVTKAAWLEAAYGSSNEVALEQDKETREWVRRHFPRDAHEPVR